MNNKKTLSSFLLLSLFLTVQSQTIETDSLVIAMQQELKYSMDQLKEKPVPAYYMSLRLNDTYSATVSSNFGVSITQESRERILTPQVRVGSPEIDNFKYECQTKETSGNGNGMQGLTVPYTDNAIMAIRQGIWSETMKRYKTAVNNYNAALSKMKTNADNEDKAPCFAPAPVETYYEQPYPEEAYTFDCDYWEKRLDRISATFKECSLLEAGIVNLNYNVERITTVTSDGSVVSQNRKSVRLMLQGLLRATDGMVCQLYKDWFSYSLDDLPDDETIIAAVRDLIERLLALRQAPIAEPYAGPALMSGSASGVFFHEIFGHRLEAHRMKSGGQTFKKLVGQPVLPKSFQVFDDPTLDNYAGTALYGHYKFDDEAVKAQRVTCVENGVLKNFLVDRTPIDGFSASNGHGRASAGYDPVSRQSNLIIENTNPYSEEELRKMFIKAVKDEGKEYGYYFRTATSGLTYLGDGGSINSFGVDPVEVYRVYVDGRPDELVRGVTLIGTPLAMFSGIAAGGATPSVFTGQCGAESGWVPVTAISPTIFITKVETQRSATGYQLPPILERPEYKNLEGNESDIIFSALQDEMERTTTSLKAEGQDAPFYVDFRMNSAKTLNIGSTLGGLYNSIYKPSQLTATENIVLGDSMVISMPLSTSFSCGNKADYDCIRYTFWQVSDALYKGAIGQYSNKLNLLKNNPKPEDEALLPEHVVLPAVEYIEPSVKETGIDRKQMEELANTLSAIYLEYPTLYNTSVTLDIQYSDVYHINSEGLKMRTPYIMNSLETKASVRTNTGAEISEYYDIPFDCSDYSIEKLSAELREFADAMITKSQAETVNEFYLGPILLEKQSVSYSFNTVVNNYGIAQTTWDMYQYMYGYIRGASIHGGMLLGKRFLDPKLNIHLYSDMESYNGVKLGGSYKIDYNGVKPESDFVMVEKGMLKNLICGRAVGIGATKPTGHSIFDRNRMSIMHVTYEKPVPLSKMKPKLIAEAKKAGLDHTYMLRNISYNCYILTRIDVKTGQETVIHSDTPSFERRELMHVIAASKEESIQSYPCNSNDFPTMIAPESMLLESVEMNLKKPDIAQEFQLVNPALR
ncbi:MAG: TldD/PmbA family protein [Bacteroidaceae bacterium]|nr:TldD/PmbA family protein [Bacteroidaceae bacterium]